MTQCLGRMTIRREGTDSSSFFTDSAESSSEIRDIRRLFQSWHQDLRPASSQRPQIACNLQCLHWFPRIWNCLRTMQRRRPENLIDRSCVSGIPAIRDVLCLYDHFFDKRCHWNYIFRVIVIYIFQSFEFTKSCCCIIKIYAVRTYRLPLVPVHTKSACSPPAIIFLKQISPKYNLSFDSYIFLSCMSNLWTVDIKYALND